MKIEVGKYVRYISGFDNDKPIVRIGKVIEVSEYVIELDTFRNGVFSKSEFLKLCMVGEPSFNPIDIIQVGDYVNGYEVTSKDQFLGIGNHDWYIADYEIKSIVTKQQFESMSYKVKE